MKKKDTTTEPEECATKQPSQQESDSEIQKYKNQLIEAAKYLSEHMVTDGGCLEVLYEQDSVRVDIDCGKIKIDATLYVGLRAKRQDDFKRYNQQRWQKAQPSMASTFMSSCMPNYPASMYMNNNSCSALFVVYYLAWAIIHEN